MYRLIEFLRSIYVFFLFVVLEGAAITFYAHSDSYTQSKLLGYSSNVVGGVGGFWSGVNRYFGLRAENEELLSRIVELEGRLARYHMVLSDSLLYAAEGGSTSDVVDQLYRRARVVSNTINKRNNYLLLNRGESSGISDGMAVITPGGAMVGYVVSSSRHFSVVMSVLNGGFRSSGKLLGDQHAGSLTWDGLSSYRVQLRELSKYADVSVGARIVSTGFSQIFPEGITIGSVVSASLNQAQTSYDVDIELAADMSALEEVLVVDNSLFGEGRRLMDDIGAYDIKLPSLVRALLRGDDGRVDAGVDAGVGAGADSGGALDGAEALEVEALERALELNLDGDGSGGGFVPNLQVVQ